MKVIKTMMMILFVVLVAQSFLTACPTCLHHLNSESAGEMENPSFDTLDNFSDLEDDAGYSKYDMRLLQGINNE